MGRLGFAEGLDSARVRGGVQRQPDSLRLVPVHERAGNCSGRTRGEQRRRLFDVARPLAARRVELVARVHGRRDSASVSVCVDRACGQCALQFGLRRVHVARRRTVLVVRVVPSNHRNVRALFQLRSVLEIPRLNLSAIVREGVDQHTLGIAVGHIPSTALPGQPGNFAIAAHRDTLFRALKDIRRDDVVTFQSPNGNYSYRVEATKIVKPSDVSVISPDGGGMVTRVISNNPADMPKLLTMITCYPFYYVGSAPKRFIVQARLIPEDGKTANVNEATETVVSVPVPLQHSSLPQYGSSRMAAQARAAFPISNGQSAHFSSWRQSPAKPRKKPGFWRRLFHAQ